MNESNRKITILTKSRALFTKFKISFVCFGFVYITGGTHDLNMNCATSYFLSQPIKQKNWKWNISRRISTVRINIRWYFNVCSYVLYPYLPFIWSYFQLLCHWVLWKNSRKEVEQISRCPTNAHLFPPRKQQIP